MAQKTRPSEVERKIHFFRIGRETSAGVANVDWRGLLEHLGSLEPRALYQEAGEGMVYLARPHSGTPLGLRFALVRRNALPSLEQDGSFQPLNVAVNQGIAEIIHVLRVDDNTLAAEYNHFGPRLPRLKFYLQRKAQAFSQGLFINALALSDAQARLRDLSFLRQFTVRVKPSADELMARASSSLGDAIRAARQMGAPEIVEIEVRSTRRGSLDGVKEIAQDLMEMISMDDEATRQVVDEGVREVSVIGFDERLHKPTKLDLLEDLLISTRRILRETPRARALDPTSAFQELRVAYEEMLPMLQRATEVR